MIVTCRDCIISFTVEEKKDTIYACPNCDKEMEAIDMSLAHDGRIANTPKFIRAMMLKPLN